MQLDTALFADAVICDYNYVFDPDIALKRFFSDRSGDYLFLIDEAHNLVERARDMYSAVLSLKELESAGRELKGIHKKFSEYLGKCIRYMKGVRDDSDSRQEILEKHRGTSHLSDEIDGSHGGYAENGSEDESEGDFDRSLF